MSADPRDVIKLELTPVESEILLAALNEYEARTHKQHIVCTHISSKEHIQDLKDQEQQIIKLNQTIRQQIVDYNNV